MNYPPQLQDYITQTQRLLHDTAGQFWQTSELTDYINSARYRIVLDSACLRSNETVSLIAGTETYPYPTGVMDVVNIFYLFGNLNTPIQYMSFSRLTAALRQVTNFQSLPVAWAQQGQTIYISPIPSQTFTAHFDCIIFPTVMVNSTDPETMPYPWWDCVSYYAAYLAIIKQADLQKAQFFMQLYTTYARANGAFRTVKGAFNG